MSAAAAYRRFVVTGGHRTEADEITRQELADLAGIPVKTLSGYLARRQIGVPAPTRYVGRTPLFDRAEAEAWSAAREARRAAVAEWSGR